LVKQFVIPVELHYEIFVIAEKTLQDDKASNFLLEIFEFRFVGVDHFLEMVVVELCFGISHKDGFILYVDLNNLV